MRRGPASPKRSAIASISAATAAAPAKSPAASSWKIARISRYAALDAVFAVALEQPLCSAEPAAPGPHLAAEDEVHPDPEGAQNGVRHVVGGEIRVMRALVESEILVVSTEHERGRRQPLEILRVERFGFVRARESLVGVLPRAVFVERPALLEVVRHRTETLTARNSAVAPPRASDAEEAAERQPGPDRADAEADPDEDHRGHREAESLHVGVLAHVLKNPRHGDLARQEQQDDCRE